MKNLLESLGFIVMLAALIGGLMFLLLMVAFYYALEALRFMFRLIVLFLFEPDE